MDFFNGLCYAQSLESSSKDLEDIMKDIRKTLIEYIYLRIELDKIMNPYYELLGDSLDIYEAIYNGNEFINKLLGLSEAQDEHIEEFVWWKRTNNEVFYHGINTVEQLADLILWEKEFYVNEK